jgi:2-dehydro-3-deoxygluconokinase
MKKFVSFGEVMLRLATPDHQRFLQADSFEVSFGGGEANVACSLSQFGLPTEFVSAVPASPIGDACINSLRRYGVGQRHMVRSGERLGIYYLESGAAQRASQVVYDRAHSSIATLAPGTIDWDAIFANAQWFHWTGITPAISESAATCCAEAIEAASKAGVPVSCDLNFRAKLWKWGKKASEVMPDLVAGCDVAIGNEEDAEKVFGIGAPAIDVTSGHVEAEAYVSVCDELIARFPKLKTVAVTLRGSKSASHNTWSAMMKHEGAVFTAPTYDVIPIVDRVGGGDSFMGGLIYGLTTYDNKQDSLNFATAASCLKHSIPGDFNIVTVAEVEKLMKGDASGRVSR